MTPERGRGYLVGLEPWLPWPLSAWTWWSRLIRGERLAVLRMGLALTLLADVLLTYLPNLADFFHASSGLGEGELYRYLRTSPKLRWSLLAGIGDPVISNVAFLIVIVLSGWLVFDVLSRILLAGRYATPEVRSGNSLWIWFAAMTVWSLGTWARYTEAAAREVGAAADAVPTPGAVCWIIPMFGLAIVQFLMSFEALCRFLHTERRHFLSWTKLCIVLGGTLMLLVLGLIFQATGGPDKDSWGYALMQPWQNSIPLLTVSCWAWVVALVFMLVGFQTRLATVVVWLLSYSFANVNSLIDNAGDTIRTIILFYLVLSPSNAAWSVDAWLRRRRAPDLGPAFVSPWALRLLYCQMIFIYWMNGLYKLPGDTWREGTSLYYVLGDLTLTRMSLVQIPLPNWMLMVMSYIVFIWELTFPLWLFTKWTRVPALILGVLFHLGILFTMELGFFVGYALCLYLPLLPWERWWGRTGETPEMIAEGKPGEPVLDSGPVEVEDNCITVSPASEESKSWPSQ